MNSSVRKKDLNSPQVFESNSRLQQNYQNERSSSQRSQNTIPIQNSTSNRLHPSSNQANDERIQATQSKIYANNIKIKGSDTLSEEPQKPNQVRRRRLLNNPQEQSKKEVSPLEEIRSFSKDQTPNDSVSMSESFHLPSELLNQSYQYREKDISNSSMLKQPQNQSFQQQPQNNTYSQASTLDSQPLIALWNLFQQKSQPFANLLHPKPQGNSSLDEISSISKDQTSDDSRSTSKSLHLLIEHLNQSNQHIEKDIPNSSMLKQPQNQSFQQQNPNQNYQQQQQNNTYSQTNTSDLQKLSVLEFRNLFIQNPQLFAKLLQPQPQGESNQAILNQANLNQTNINQPNIGQSNVNDQFVYLNNLCASLSNQNQQLQKPSPKQSQSLPQGYQAEPATQEKLNNSSLSKHYDHQKRDRTPNHLKTEYIRKEAEFDKESHNNWESKQEYHQHKGENGRNFANKSKNSQEEEEWENKQQKSKNYNEHSYQKVYRIKNPTYEYPEKQSRQKFNILPSDDEIERELQEGRLICFKNAKCYDEKCQFLHGSLLCQGESKCDDSCERIHFTDLVTTLYNKRSFSKDEYLNSWNFTGLTLRDILDYRITLNKLAEEKRSLKKKVIGLKENSGAEGNIAENRIHTNEQIEAVRDRIDQIEMIMENYIISVSKIVLQVLAYFKERKSDILTDLKLEADCALKILPIYAKKIDLIDFLENDNPKKSFLVLSGETGCGKSTQIPIYTLQYLRSRKDLGKAVIVQPRKIAAHALAERICDELDISIGSDVGYIIGWKKNDKCVSEQTRVILMTDNEFLELLSDDPELKQYSVVVVDEAHERTISSDSILGVLMEKISKKKIEHNLKVIVTSASIDVSKFAKYLNDAAELKISGRQHPITIKYEPLNSNLNINIIDIKNLIVKLLQDKKRILADRTKYYRSNPNVSIDINVYTGHMLVFVTSIRDLERLKELLVKEYKEDSAGRGTMHKMRILKFHSKMQLVKYNQIFEPESPEKITKIILATKIAETSLTFPDLSIVIDTGIDRESFYNPLRNLNELKFVKISKSSAKQRAGRAGRTRPGICFRLYSLDFYNKLKEAREADFLKSNIELPILNLKRLGIKNIANFELLDPIPEGNISNAEQNLSSYKAINPRTGDLTDTGIQMSSLPIEPFLSRPLFMAVEHGVFHEVAKIVAMIKFGSGLFSWGENFNELKKTQEKLWNELYDEEVYKGADGDHFFYLFLLEEFLKLHKPRKMKGFGERVSDPAKDWCTSNYLIYNTFKAAAELYHEFVRLFQKDLRINHQQPKDNDFVSTILECLFSTHLLNLCYYSDNPSLGYFLVREEDRLDNVYIHQNSLLHMKEANTKWIVFSEAQEFEQLIVYSVTNISEERLKYYVRFSRYLERVRPIMKIIQDKSIKSLKVDGLGTSALKELEKRLIEQNKGRKSNKFLYKWDHRQGIMTFWIPALYAEVKQEISRYINDIQENLKAEVFELEVKRNARAVIGTKAKIKDLLVDDQTLTLVISDIDNDISTDEICQAIQKTCGTKLQQIMPDYDGDTNQKTVTVVCKNRKDVEGLLEQGIIVGRRKLQFKPQEFSYQKEKTIRFRCKAVVCTGISKGEAAIFLDEEKKAQNLAKKLDGATICDSKVFAVSARNRVRLSNLDLAVDDAILKKILKEEDYEFCSVYRREYALAQDQEKEKREIFAFLKAEADQYRGEFVEEFSTRTKMIFKFDFVDCQDAMKFIERTDGHQMSCKLTNKKETVKKLIHCTPLIDRSDLCLFRDRYLVFKKDFEECAKSLNRIHSDKVAIYLPHPKQLESSSFVKIRIEPLTPVTNIREVASTISAIKSELSNIAKGEEVTCLSEHRLYPLIFTKEYEKTHLREIAQNNGVFISAKRTTRTLQIYGKKDNIAAAVYSLREILDEEKDTMITDSLSADSIDASMFFSKGITYFQRQFPEVYIYPKISKGSFVIEFIGSADSIHDAKTKILNTHKLLNPESKRCSLCNTHSIRNQWILDCGHEYCFSCIKSYLINLCRNRQLDWKCFKKDCGRGVIMRDIMGILPLEELTDYATYFVKKRYLEDPKSDFVECLCGLVGPRKQWVKAGTDNFE